VREYLKPDGVLSELGTDSVYPTVRGAVEAAERSPEVARWQSLVAMAISAFT
jgi:hypothetical protein